MILKSRKIESGLRGMHYYLFSIVPEGRYPNTPSTVMLLTTEAITTNEVAILSLSFHFFLLDFSAFLYTSIPMIIGIILNNTTPDTRRYFGPATLGSKYALAAPYNMTAASRNIPIAIPLTLFYFFIAFLL
jgi:hypothetical protein